MANVQIAWLNLERFKTDTQSFTKKYEKQILRLIKITVDEIIRDVKRWTPVRSGRLERSWQKRKIRGAANYEIWNSQDYATFVENGTRYRRPIRMLQKAMIKGEIRLKKRLQDLAKKMERDF